MKEMMIINRILVVVMISISAFIALNVESIMEAVIVATVIGTTSYFFPIIGGLYWRRATKWGALGALIAGGGTQIMLILYELFWLKQPLDTISPLLTEHGVLVGLSLSAISFIGLSLVTPQTESIRLAPFFSDIADEVFENQKLQANRNSSPYRDVVGKIDHKISGERAHMNLFLDIQPVQPDGARISHELNWDGFVQCLKAVHPRWYTPTGSHIIYRLSQADMLAGIKMVRGDVHQIWLSAEPKATQVERQKDELYISYEEMKDALNEFGFTALPSKL